MPDKKKHQKIVPNTKIQAAFPCKQRSTQFLYTVYMHIVHVGTSQQALLLKLIDAHPSPCTHVLRFC